MFVIVGFCDVYSKAKGTEDVTYFRQADRLLRNDLPTADFLKEYATRLGYYPSGRPGASAGICYPVYLEVPGAG